MSRIGKNPIELPSGVEVNVNGADVEVKGSKGTLVQTVADGISVSVDDGVVTVERANDERICTRFKA